MAVGDLGAPPVLVAGPGPARFGAAAVGEGAVVVGEDAVDVGALAVVGAPLDLLPGPCGWFFGAVGADGVDFVGPPLVLGPNGMGPGLPDGVGCVGVVGPVQPGVCGCGAVVSGTTGVSTVPLTGTVTMWVSQNFFGV